MHRILVIAALGLAACGAPQGLDALSPPSPEAVGAWESARSRLLDDYAPWMGPYEVRPRGGAATVYVPAETGWCYAYFAVGGAGVSDLDLEVRDADGRIAGSDTMFDATPYVQHCADRAERMEVVVRVARGRGEAAFGVLRKPD